MKYMSTAALFLIASSGVALAEVDGSGFVNMCSSNGDTVEVCTCAANELITRIGTEKFVEMNTVAGQMYELQQSGQAESEAYMNLRTRIGELTSLDGAAAIHYFHSIDACL